MCRGRIVAWKLENSTISPNISIKPRQKYEALSDSRSDLIKEKLCTVATQFYQSRPKQICLILIVRWLVCPKPLFQPHVWILHVMDASTRWWEDKTTWRLVPEGRSPGHRLMVHIYICNAGRWFIYMQRWSSQTTGTAATSPCWSICAENLKQLVLILEVNRTGTDHGDTLTICSANEVEPSYWSISEHGEP